MNKTQEQQTGEGEASRVTMREFFERADIAHAQRIQKANAFNTKPHMDATAYIVREAKLIGVEI